MTWERAGLAGGYPGLYVGVEVELLSGGPARVEVRGSWIQGCRPARTRSRRLTSVKPSGPEVAHPAQVGLGGKGGRRAAVVVDAAEGPGGGFGAKEAGRRRTLDAREGSAGGEGSKQR